MAKKSKQTVAQFELSFEMNPDYTGRENILKAMAEAGFEDEADELRASVCSDCLGTGVVDNMVMDTDSHQYVWDGEKECHHVKADRESDRADEAWKERY